MKSYATTAAGCSTRLTWALSALCGAAAVGLVIAGCLALAREAETVLGWAVPALAVRAVMALLGVPAALLTEAGVHRLLSTRGRPAAPAAPAPAEEKRLLLRPDPVPDPRGRLTPL